MKKKAEIAKLSAYAQTVDFPPTNEKLSRYEWQLRQLLDENFGAAARNTEYDPESQEFSWEEKHYVGKTGDTRINAQRYFAINPKLDLLGEFERIQEEREAFVAAVRLIHKRCCAEDE